MKKLSDTLLELWAVFEVKPQECQMIDAAILAKERNVVCRHVTFFLLSNAYHQTRRRCKAGSRPLSVSP